MEKDSTHGKKENCSYCILKRSLQREFEKFFMILSCAMWLNALKYFNILTIVYIIAAKCVSFYKFVKVNIFIFFLSHSNEKV